MTATTGSAQARRRACDEVSSRSAGSPYWLLAALAVAATALGIVAYVRYRSSERVIRASIGDFQRTGSTVGAEGCVDEVLAWSRRCTAILGLCDASVSRLTNACLGARDRSTYCRGVARSINETHFGVQGCKARRAKGAAKKACASAYRMIAAYCSSLEATKGTP